MSQPQLVIQDFGGRHNQSLGEARSRLIRGGSWKKQRIVLVLPSADLIPAKVALSHWNLIFPPNQGVVRVLALGQEVGDAYSTAIAQILAHPDLGGWEYLLTIEHDNMPPSDGIVKLAAQMDAHKEFAAISGLYFTKGEGGVAQIWGDPQDPVTNYRPQVPIMNAVQECCGIGMGFSLWRLAMFKDDRLRKPWFKTLQGTEGLGVSTQDLYAWSDLRKYGYRCAVDTSVSVGHYDHLTDTCW